MNEPQLTGPPPLRGDIPPELVRMFDRVLGKSAAEMERWFSQAIAELGKALDPSELERQLRETRSPERWLTQNRAVQDAFADFRQHLQTPFLGALENGQRPNPEKAAMVQTYLQASKMAGASEPLPKSWWSLDRFEEEATTWARQQAAAKVVNIDHTTREGIRAAVEEAFGNEPRSRESLARAIYALDGKNGMRVGLAPGAQRSFQKWIAETITPGMAPARAQALIDRQYKALLKRRAMLIAHTESVYAANAGQIAAYAGAVEDGKLDENLYELEWVARAIRCPRCAAFDGTRREIRGGRFSSNVEFDKGLPSTTKAKPANPVPNPKPVEPLIATQGIRSRQQNADHSFNKVQKLEMEDGTTAYWKPSNAGQANWLEIGSGAGGDMADREVFAYNLDRALGLNIVPETAYRKIDGVSGSIQRGANGDEVVFQSNSFLRDLEKDGRRIERLRPALFDMSVLDYLTGNMDRHGGNALIDGDLLHAIDNGHSLLTAPFTNSSNNFARPWLQQLGAPVWESDGIRYRKSGRDAAAKSRLAQRLASDELAATLKAATWLSTDVRRALEERIRQLKWALEQEDETVLGNLLGNW